MCNIPFVKCAICEWELELSNNPSLLRTKLNKLGDAIEVQIKIGRRTCKQTI
jgi:hypothetical protein